MVLVQKEIKRVVIRPNGSEVQIRPKLPPMIDFLLVGGGGGGGKGSYRQGGGGGGGQVIYCEKYEIVKGTSYCIRIGAGGGGQANGCNSCMGNIIAKGGCAGSQYDGGTSGSGCIGGSSATAPNGQYAAGGGGGACTKGCNATCVASSCQTTGGHGGWGYSYDISGAIQSYGGGGGGGGNTYKGSGRSGGGAGGCYGVAGSNATGYGGGGGGNGNNVDSPGSGRKGVFIARYPTACGYNITGGCKYTCGDYTIHCFTSNGTLTVS